MVGGDKPTFDLVLPIFQAMGKTITHLGPLGAGGFTKLANQIIVAVNLTALGEALTLAKKAGLNRELTLKALGGGLAGSRCLEQKTPNYLSNTYNPGFRVDLHFKDLGLIMESVVPWGSRCRRRRWCKSSSPRSGCAAGGGSTTPRSSRCSKTSRAGREGHRRPGRARLGEPHAPHQDPARPQGRPVEGPDVIEQAFGDYFERLLGTRPRQVFGGAQYVHHRWLMEPWGCFVAEENDGKIIGAVVAVMWGTSGSWGRWRC